MKNKLIILIISLVLISSLCLAFSPSKETGYVESDELMGAFRAPMRSAVEDHLHIGNKTVFNHIEPGIFYSIVYDNVPGIPIGAKQFLSENKLTQVFIFNEDTQQFDFVLKLQSGDIFGEDFQIWDGDGLFVKSDEQVDILFGLNYQMTGRKEFKKGWNVFSFREEESFRFDSLPLDKVENISTFDRGQFIFYIPHLDFGSLRSFEAYRFYLIKAKEDFTFDLHNKTCDYEKSNYCKDDALWFKEVLNDCSEKHFFISECLNGCSNGACVVDDLSQGTWLSNLSCHNGNIMNDFLHVNDEITNETYFVCQDGYECKVGNYSGEVKCVPEGGCVPEYRSQPYCDKDKVMQNFTFLDCYSSDVVKEECEFDCDNGQCVDYCDSKWLNDWKCEGNSYYRLRLEDDCSKNFDYRGTCASNEQCSLDNDGRAFCERKTCDSKWLNHPTCESGNVVDEWQYSDCTTTRKIRDECDYGCKNGMCQARQCKDQYLDEFKCQSNYSYIKYEESNCHTGWERLSYCFDGCGTDGKCIGADIEYGDYICRGKSLYQEVNFYNNRREHFVEYCSDGCENGACRDTPCDAGFVENRCIGDELYEYTQNENCLETGRKVKTCENGCSNGACVADPIEPHWLNNDRCVDGKVADDWMDQFGRTTQMTKSFCQYGCENAECLARTCEASIEKYCDGTTAIEKETRESCAVVTRETQCNSCLNGECYYEQDPTVEAINYPGLYDSSEIVEYGMNFYYEWIATGDYDSTGLEISKNSDLSKLNHYMEVNKNDDNHYVLVANTLASKSSSIYIRPFVNKDGLKYYGDWGEIKIGFACKPEEEVLGVSSPKLSPSLLRFNERFGYKVNRFVDFDRLAYDFTLAVDGASSFLFETLEQADKELRNNGIYRDFVADKVDNVRIFVDDYSNRAYVFAEENPEYMYNHNLYYSGLVFKRLDDAKNFIGVHGSNVIHGTMDFASSCIKDPTGECAYRISQSYEQANQLVGSLRQTIDDIGRTYTNMKCDHAQNPDACLKEIIILEMFDNSPSCLDHPSAYYVKLYDQLIEEGRTAEIAKAQMDTTLSFIGGFANFGDDLAQNIIGTVINDGSRCLMEMEDDVTVECAFTALEVFSATQISKLAKTSKAVKGGKSVAVTDDVGKTMTSFSKAVQKATDLGHDLKGSYMYKGDLYEAFESAVIRLENSKFYDKVKNVPVKGYEIVYKNALKEADNLDEFFRKYDEVIRASGKTEQDFLKAFNDNYKIFSKASITKYYDLLNMGIDFSKLPGYSKYTRKEILSFWNKFGKKLMNRYAEINVDFYRIENEINWFLKNGLTKDEVLSEFYLMAKSLKNNSEVFVHLDDQIGAFKVIHKEHGLDGLRQFIARRNASDYETLAEFSLLKTTGEMGSVDIFAKINDYRFVMEQKSILTKLKSAKTLKSKLVDAAEQLGRSELDKKIYIRLKSTSYSKNQIINIVNGWVKNSLKGHAALGLGKSKNYKDWKIYIDYPEKSTWELLEIIPVVP